MRRDSLWGTIWGAWVGGGSLDPCQRDGGGMGLSFTPSVCLWTGVGQAVRVKCGPQSVMYTLVGKRCVNNSDQWKIQKSNGEVLMHV